MSTKLSDEDMLAALPDEAREFIQEVQAMVCEQQKELLERLIEEFSAAHPKAHIVRG